MRSTDSKSSSPKPASSDDLSPPIAVDAHTGAMRDIPVSPAPPAASGVQPAAPPVEFSHRPEAYGALIETTFDHTRARCNHLDGTVEDFASELNVEPTAFQQAIQAAKAAWKVGVARDEAETLRKRQELVDAATIKNRKA